MPFALPAWLLSGFSSLPYRVSSPSPTNTQTVPNHCRVNSECPKNITEARIVKNFLVVVAIEHANGPNVVTVRKINA